MDASPIPVSMRNDSALASRWFWPFAMASLTTPAENPMVKIKLRGLAVLRISWSSERSPEHQSSGSMGLNGVVKRQKRNLRPQNTPILNGGFRADVVSTRKRSDLFHGIVRRHGMLRKFSPALVYQTAPKANLRTLTM